jgi:lantibiotic modifying enzyme
MALAEAAKWPGPSEDKKNPYFNLTLAKAHELKVEYMIAELERQDDEISNMSVSYDTITRLPWAPLPMDASFWQKHAI